MKLGRTLRPPSSATFDFTALGENSLDTFVVATGPEYAGKQTASSLAEHVGGQAATAAVAVARLGWRSRYIGVVGDDSAGDVVRLGLETEQVHTVVTTRAGARTRRAVIVVDGPTGERRVFEHRDPALALQDSDAVERSIGDTRILLVDLTDPAGAIRAARAARAADVRTFVDIDRPDPVLRDLLPLVDIIVMAAASVSAIAGTSDLSRGLARIGEDAGAAAVIATLGPEGALTWCRGKEVRSSASRAEVVDTTGAGDAFRAGFAAGWLGRPGVDPELEDLLADAHLVAGLNCRALGAQTGLPQALEVPRHLRGRV